MVILASQRRSMRRGGSSLWQQEKRPQRLGSFEGHCAQGGARLLAGSTRWGCTRDVASRRMEEQRGLYGVCDSLVLPNAFNTLRRQDVASPRSSAPTTPPLQSKAYPPFCMSEARVESWRPDGKSARWPAPVTRCPCFSADCPRASLVGARSIWPVLVPK